MYLYDMISKNLERVIIKVCKHIKNGYIKNNNAYDSMDSESNKIKVTNHQVSYMHLCGYITDSYKGYKITPEGKRMLRDHYLSKLI